MDFTKLDELLSSLPGFAKLTPEMKTAALNGARIPDEAGVWPGQPGYVDTYDVYFAALKLVPFLQAQPFITSAGSEGTNISVKQADWSAIIKFYRESSQIILASGNDVLTRVLIPDVSHVVHAPMNDGGGYYGDVDSDIG